MKLKKLVGKAEAFVDSKERSRKEKQKYLKHVLHKLSKHEKDLKKRLEDTTDDLEKEKLAKKLARTHAQRKKGIALLQDLKSKS